MRVNVLLKDKTIPKIVAKNIHFVADGVVAFDAKFTLGLSETIFCIWTIVSECTLRHNTVFLVWLEQGTSRSRVLHV